MNILIFNTSEMYPQKGGVQRVSYNLTEEFIKRGHQVVHMIPKRTYVDEPNFFPCEMICLQSDDYNNKQTIATIQDALLQYKIDVVLVQSYWAPKVVECFKKNCDIPVVVAVHNMPKRDIQALKNGVNLYSNWFTKAKIKEIVKFVLHPYIKYKVTQKTKDWYTTLYKNSDKIVLLSDKFKPELRDVVKDLDETRVTSIFNFNQMEKPMQQCEKENVVLFVGRLSFASKRVDRIIRIWEKIYKRYPDWTLKIAGDGECKADMMRYVAKKKIHNVEFLGFVDSEQEYKKAKILCMTSTYEGFGLVLIEAGIYGCVPMAFDS